MNSPSVTVILSIYNGAKTLERCLKSIADQTFLNIHILCIDDASTDATSDILHHWKKRMEKQVTIIRNSKNLGLTLSLNKGIDITTTPFIARIDSDDWWEPDKLEKQIAFLNTHPEYGIVGTNYINHSEKAKDFSRLIILPETDEAIRNTIFWRNPFAHSAVCYRTNTIRVAGKYNPRVRYSQDYELWVRCLPYTKFHNLQEFLCHRTLGSGISVDRQNAQARLYIKVLRTYLPKYQRPLKEYGAMIEPMVVILTPEWIKKIKRRFL